MTPRQRLSILGSGLAALAIVVGTAIVLDLAGLIDLDHRNQSEAVAALSAFLAVGMSQWRKNRIRQRDGAGRQTPRNRI